MFATSSFVSRFTIDTLEVLLSEVLVRVMLLLLTTALFVPRWTATPVGPAPTFTGAAAVSVPRSTTVIESPPALATTARFVSGLIATPRGKSPTGIVEPAPVANEITVTELPPRLVTTAWLVRGLTAIPDGLAPA